jgi:tryptophan synthase alpha chain
VLERYIRERLRDRDILLMTHIVLGYPSFDTCFKVVEEMVQAGVDLMELQIPFSEPMADGPVILRANHTALKNGATVRACLDFAGELASAFDIPFLVMTYYNIPFQFGVGAFVEAMAMGGIRGAITADLPPEEGVPYRDAMRAKGLSPVYLFSPTSSDARMKYIASHADGFMYCVARKGVTGQETAFSGEVGRYLGRCRKATPLPLAVGFGVMDRKDVDFLKGKADIAVVGTHAIRVLESGGPADVGRFIGTLR